MQRNSGNDSHDVVSLGASPPFRRWFDSRSAKRYRSHHVARCSERSFVLEKGNSGETPGRPGRCDQRECQLTLHAFLSHCRVCDPSLDIALDEKVSKETVGSQKTYHRKRHEVICQGQIRVISRVVMKASCV